MSDKSDSEDIFIKVDTKPAKKLSKTKAKTEEQKNRIAEILAAGRAKRAEKLAKAKTEKISTSMTEAEIRKLIEKINNESAKQMESRGDEQSSSRLSRAPSAPSPREEQVKQEPVKETAGGALEPAKQEPIKQEPVKEPVIDTQAQAKELRRKNAAKLRLLYGNRFG